MHEHMTPLLMQFTQWQAIWVDKLHVKPKSLGIAGMQDKRAEPSQRVSVWRVEPAVLAKLNTSLD